MRRLEGFSKLLASLSHPLVLVGVVLIALFGLYDQLINAGIFQPLAQGETAPVVHELLDHGFIIGLAVVVLGFALQFYKLFLGRPLVVVSDKQAETVAERNRQRMLEKVRYMWVEGVLEQSLYQVARIELGFAEEPEAIEHPWKLVAQQPERAPKELPDGVRMLEVFDQFGETLLILGAPGSGKTTLLLELARDLIKRAKEDPAHPIPVVFNLSSWALKRPSLVNWLVEELNQRYDVPRKVAQSWIDSDQVLPLLDGLDEVAPEHRDACVEAINTFREAHGLLPLVVCSRGADYAALTEKLRLLGAATIQPLTREQVEQYLERAGKGLSGVSSAVRDDETLWELLDTPLMLSIVALAYQGPMGSVARIARLKGSLVERRAALFDAYIKAMFTRRETDVHYTPEQTKHWLSWLARVMRRDAQSTFYPNWLGSETFDAIPEEPRKQLDRDMTRVFLITLVLAFFGIVACSVWQGLWSWNRAQSHGLFFGLLFGVPVSIVYFIGSERRTQRAFPLITLLLAWLIILPSDYDIEALLMGANSNWPPIVLVFGLPAALLIGYFTAFLIGLPIGAAFGLFSGLIRVIWSTLRDARNEIDILQLAMDGALNGVALLVVTGVVAGFGVWLFDGVTGISVREWFPIWAALWFSFWLCNLILEGALHGLLRSMGVGVLTALLFGLLGGVCEGLLAGLLAGLLVAYIVLSLFLVTAVDMSQYLVNDEYVDDKTVVSIVAKSHWYFVVLFVATTGLAVGLMSEPAFGLVGAGCVAVVLGAGILLGKREGGGAPLNIDAQAPFAEVLAKSDLHTKASRSLLFWALVQMQDDMGPEELPALRGTTFLPVRNALLTGLAVGSATGLLFGLSVGAVVGVAGAISAGVGVGLAFGGFTYLRSWFVRLVLWRSNVAPFEYIRFLEYAKDLLFLRKVGGGYIFAHRLLMEHFAGLEAKNAVVHTAGEATR